MSEQKVWCPLLIQWAIETDSKSVCMGKICAWYVPEKGCAVKVLAEREPLYHVTFGSPTSFDKTGWDSK